MSTTDAQVTLNVSKDIIDAHARADERAAVVAEVLAILEAPCGCDHPDCLSREMSDLARITLHEISLAERAKKKGPKGESLPGQARYFESFRKIRRASAHEGSGSIAR